MGRPSKRIPPACPKLPRSGSASVRTTSPSLSERRKTLPTGKKKVTAVGQKVNRTVAPGGSRRTSRRVGSRDSAKGQRYRDYVNEDVKILKLMSEGMERAGISKVEIERTRERVASTSTLLVRHRHRPSRCEADRIRGELEKLTGKQVS